MTSRYGMAKPLASVMPMATKRQSHFRGGLRAFFEYRDLGISSASEIFCKCDRAIPGRHAEPSGIRMILTFK